MQSKNPSELHQLARRPKVDAWLLANAPAAAQELGLGQAQVAAPPPLPSASQAVELALRDAQHLLDTNGPVSCIDRMHTALHGYMREVCSAANLPVAHGAALPTLFKAVREQHPRFVTIGQHDPHVINVLASLAQAITNLNTLRNNASIAHPNVVLLGEPEAMLMVNLVRTMFNYLQARL